MNALSMDIRNRSVLRYWWSIVWLVLLMSWSVFASLFAGEKLGQWPLQVGFVILTLSFCSAVFFQGYKCISGITVLIFGGLVQLLSGFIMYHDALESLGTKEIEANVKASHQQKVLWNEQLDSLQEDKYRELDRFSMFQERTEFHVAEGLPIEDHLIQAHERHLSILERIDERMMDLQDRLVSTDSFNHHSSVDNGLTILSSNLSSLGNMQAWVSSSDVPFSLNEMINLIATLGSLCCLFYGFHLLMTKVEPDEPHQDISSSGHKALPPADYSQVETNHFDSKGEESSGADAKNKISEEKISDEKQRSNTLIAKPKFNAEFLTRSTSNNYNSVEPSMSQAKNSPKDLSASNSKSNVGTSKPSPIED